MESKWVSDELPILRLESLFAEIAETFICFHIKENYVCRGSLFFAAGNK